MAYRDRGLCVDGMRVGRDFPASVGKGLTLFPPRGIGRALRPCPRASRGPPTAPPKASGGSRGCSRTVTALRVRLAHSQTLADLLLPILGPATLPPGDSSKEHTKTLNIDLIYSDRARSRDSGSRPGAAGTVPAAASLDKVLAMILITAGTSGSSSPEEFAS